MHDSDSGIEIDSGISTIFAGIGTGIRIRDFKRYWNRNRNRNQRIWSWNRNRNPGYLNLVTSLSYQYRDRTTNLNYWITIQYHGEVLLTSWNRNRNRNQGLRAGIGMESVDFLLESEPESDF